MLIRRIEGATRIFGSPSTWDGKQNPVCGTLPVLDALDEYGNPLMISAWEPTPEELELIVKGHAILLYIVGINHPIVSISVAMKGPTDD